MSLDRQKLTAYALGELRGDEAREVETQLRSDPLAKRFVDETRAFAQLAERDLRSEPMPSGRGAGAVLQEIVRRQSARPPLGRVWLQAGAIAAVIVLFTLALPHRQQFRGQVARILGAPEAGTETSTDTATDEDTRLTHRTVKDDPRALERELDSLAERPRVLRNVRGCRISLPEAGPGDRVGTDHVTYYLTESGLAIDVKIFSAPQPLVHELGVEEVGAVPGVSLFRRVLGAQSVAFHVVPETGSLPYCTVEVGSDWQVPDASRKVLGPAFDELGHSLAKGMTAVVP